MIYARSTYPQTSFIVEIYNAVQAGRYANRFSPSRILHARLELERANVLERTGDKVIMDGAARQTYRLCEQHHGTRATATHT